MGSNAAERNATVGGNLRPSQDDEASRLRHQRDPLQPVSRQVPIRAIPVACEGGSSMTKPSQSRAQRRIISLARGVGCVPISDTCKSNARASSHAPAPIKGQRGDGNRSVGSQHLSCPSWRLTGTRRSLVWGCKLRYADMQNRHRHCWKRQDGTSSRHPYCASKFPIPVHRCIKHPAWGGVRQVGCVVQA